VLRTKAASSAPEPVPKRRGPHLYELQALQNWRSLRPGAPSRAVGLAEVSISRAEARAA
jgi:hypothetical protein